MPLEAMLVAGEASGDARGAELIEALRQQNSDARFSGLGGPKMAAAGMEVLEDITAEAVVGIVDVLKKYRFFKGVFDRLLAEIERRRPAVLVGIDYPGFNLRLAEAIRKRMGSARPYLVQYVSPQLWAWRANRRHRMARDLDLVLCLFPFEPEIYADTSLRAVYVGHPLLQSIAWNGPDRRDSSLVALFPGSRRREIDHHRPVLEQIRDRVARELPWARFAVAGRPPLSWPGVAVEPPEKLLSQAAVAVVASGTATLEAALSGLPQLVIYKVSPFTFWLGRQLVKIPHLAMPNVLTREEIVPEFLQERCSADLLAPALIDLLSTPERQEKMRSDYLRMRALLGQKNAAAEAARQIWQGVVRGSACVG